MLVCSKQSIGIQSITILNFSLSAFHSLRGPSMNLAGQQGRRSQMDDSLRSDYTSTSNVLPRGKADL